MNKLEKPKENILIYSAPDSEIKVEVIYGNESVWLSQMQMVQLFKSSKANISEHIKRIFEEGELQENSVVRNFRTTANDGKKYNTKYYNLDVIISVGYRVKSIVGTQFRIWATKVLKEYMTKGFAMNDEVLKNNSRSVYFEELLARIRDIRSSEKVFWRKVLDIYATSIDYDPKSEITINIFKTIQNKMHYAAHGNTAAEVIFSRVDSRKDNIGLTNFKGNYPVKEDVEIAKNYLTREELNILNRIVTAYLEVAEINALSLIPMKMSDWAKELDVFLKMTKKDILNHKGKVSHEQALKKAREEYEKYKLNNLTSVEKDYLEIISGKVEKLK